MGIGQVSELIGRSPDTLRRWERVGLVVPHRDRRGRRVYSNEQVAQCRELARLGPVAQRKSVKLTDYIDGQPKQLSLFG